MGRHGTKYNSKEQTIITMNIRKKKKKILFIELNIFSLSCHFCMFFKALLQKVLQGR